MSGILWEKKSPNISSFRKGSPSPLRLKRIRQKRQGNNSVQFLFTCIFPLLLGYNPPGIHSWDCCIHRGLLCDGFWIFLHHYLEAAEIYVFVFQRPWLWSLLFLEASDFKRCLKKWKSSVFPHSPSHWDLSPQSLYLCLSSPIRPLKTLLVTLSFNTAPLARNTTSSQPLTL